MKPRRNPAVQVMCGLLVAGFIRLELFASPHEHVKYRNGDCPNWQHSECCPLKDPRLGPETCSTEIERSVPSGTVFFVTEQLVLVKSKAAAAHPNRPVVLYEVYRAW